MNASPFASHVAIPSSRLHSSLRRICDLWLILGANGWRKQNRDRCSNIPRINTYRCLSKQMALTAFRMNTYKKPRGEGVIVNQQRKSKAS